MNLLTGLLTAVAIMGGVNGLGLIAYMAATRQHDTHKPGRHRATPKHAATTGARR